MKKKKASIVNVDLTITCENIFFGNKKKLIQNSLIKLLKTKYVNVKATRFEHPSSKIKCDTVVLLKTN
jgi:2C-methyl-D-erythritol 2,4-cyclodiphosphate synthase